MSRQQRMLYGANRLSDLELLAMLLSGTTHRRATLASRLLERVGPLARFLRLGEAELRACGLGSAEAARLLAATELGQRMGKDPGEIRSIREPQDAYHCVARELSGVDRERFVAVVLDVRNRPQRIVRVAEGSVDTCVVDPREVFVHAVRERGSSVLVAHNHPSGDPTPSREDRALTKRLCQAGKVLGLPLLDHIIVGADGAFVSMAHSGRRRPRRRRKVA